VFFPPVFLLIIHGKLVSVHARLFLPSMSEPVARNHVFGGPADTLRACTYDGNTTLFLISFHPLLPLQSYYNNPLEITLSLGSLSLSSYTNARYVNAVCTHDSGSSNPQSSTGLVDLPTLNILRVYVKEIN